MTFMELASMSDSDQMEWMAEHSEEECSAILTEFLSAMKRDSIDYSIRSFRERMRCYEISKAVMRGCYCGTTSDGKPWRIDFSNPHNDDWRDEYFLSDYEY